MKIVFNDSKKEDQSYLTKLIDIYLKDIVDYSKANNKFGTINIYTDDDVNKLYGIYIADYVEIVNYGNNNKRIDIYSLLKHKRPFNIFSKDGIFDELNDIGDGLIEIINVCRSFRDEYENNVQSMSAISMLKNIIYERKDISYININGLFLNRDDNLMDISIDIFTICMTSTHSYDIEFLDEDLNAVNSDTKDLEALLAIILLTTRRSKKIMLKKFAKKRLNKFKTKY